LPVPGSPGARGAYHGDAMAHDHADRSSEAHAQPAAEPEAARAPGRSTLVDESAGQTAGQAALPRTQLTSSPDAPSWQPAHDSGGGGGVISHAAVGRAEASPVPHPAPSVGTDPVAGADPEIHSATVLHAPHGADTRTDVGVGEVVHFSSPVAGQWQASHGTPHSSGAVAKFTWTAPAKAGSTKITLKAGTKTVVKTFTVHAPDSLHFKLKSIESFPKGQQGVGMYTDLTVGPTNVSFGNTEWLEVGEAGTNVTGYFKKFNASTLVHHPTPSWLRWNEKNTSIWDHASLFQWPAPWSVGGFQWTIPNKWRVASVGGNGHVFTTTHQVFHMTDTQGTTSVSKGGVSTTRTP
jgi:hypothetical protein